MLYLFKLLYFCIMQKYNNEFEKIDMVEKAYVLGFFYSDGNVSNNQKHCRIQLAGQDKEILEEIQLQFPFFKLYKEKRSTKITLYAGTKSFHRDLLANGCIPAKSAWNKEFLRFHSLGNKELDGAFIRGLWDGDGTYTLSAEGPKIQKRIALYSNSKTFVTDISSLLTNYDINNTIIRTETKPNNFSSVSGIIYKLSVRTESYLKFYNFIYSENLFLKRKRDKFNKLLEYKIFVQKPNINCKYCNSTNTVANGYNIYKGIKKQRFLCKNCKRHTAQSSSDITLVQV